MTMPSGTVTTVANEQAPQQRVPDLAGDILEPGLGDDRRGWPFLPAAAGPHRPLADVAADDINEERRPEIGERCADLALGVQHDDAGEDEEQPEHRTQHGIEGECPAHAAVAEQQHAEATAEIVAAMAWMGCGGLHHTPSPTVLPAAPLPCGRRAVAPATGVAGRSDSGSFLTRFGCVVWQLGRQGEGQLRCRRWLQRCGCAGIDRGDVLLDRGPETFEALAARVLAIGMELVGHLAAVAVGEHRVLEHMDDDRLQLPDAVARRLEQVVVPGKIERVATGRVGIGAADQLLDATEPLVQRRQGVTEHLLDLRNAPGECLHLHEQLGTRVILERALDQLAHQLGDALAAVLAQLLQPVVHLLVEAHGRPVVCCSHSSKLPVGWWRMTGRLAQFGVVVCCSKPVKTATFSYSVETTVEASLEFFQIAT